MIGRLSGVLVAATVMITVAATPAFADPARPTNFESTVTEITPAVPGLTADIAGGDAFVTVAVPAGTSAVVSGYEAEPYIRFDADGQVFENRRSPAYWLNTERYGVSSGAVPAEAGPDAAPDWHLVSDTGEWAWHDHRIHWMSPDLPPAIDAETESEVFEWSIPMEVDGEAVVVAGVLVWHPSATPLPWIVVVAVTVAAAFLAARMGITGTGAVVTVGGLMALAVSLSQATLTPPGAGGELLSQGAAFAATAGGLATMLVGRRTPSVGDLPALVGAVLLAVWALQRIATLWMPVLPSALPIWAERLMVAGALGCAAAGLAAALMRRLVISPRPAVP